MRKINRQSNSMGMQGELVNIMGNKQVKGKVVEGNNYDSVQHINQQKMKIPGARSKVGGKDSTRHSLIVVNPQDKENNDVNQAGRPREHEGQAKKHQMASLQTMSIEKPKPPSLAQQREVERKHLRQTYGVDIYKYLTHRADRLEHNINNGFLDKHEITGRLRAKMVDWMVEVLCSYKCSEQTFFCAVFILDQYFRKSTRKVKVSELHLSGVVAMWIASKYEEIYPLRLKTLEQKIAHGKLTQLELKTKETEIMGVLQFQFEEGSLYEQALLVAQLIDLQQVFNNQKTYEYFNKVIIYLTKMILHDYSLVSTVSRNYLATAALYVAFKIIEQIQVSFSTSKTSADMMAVTQQNEEKLFDAAQKVLNLAKNFETLFPSLENLKKFNGFQLDEKNQ